jgi:hypothetical protein
MSNEFFIGIFIGVIFGLAFSLDMIFSSKLGKRQFHIRIFVVVISVILPRTVGLFAKTDDTVLAILTYTLPVFTIVVLLGFVISYVFYRRLKNHYKSSIFSSEVITFADLMLKGYLVLKQDIIAGKQKDEERLNESNKTMFDIMGEISEPISKFIIEINKLYTTVILKEMTVNGYIIFVLHNFIRKFLSESDARFTLRKLDAKNNRMVAEITTVSEKPSSIPLNVPSMILQSMEQNKPLLFSENQDYHYDTGKSIKDGKYNDYVSYCLVKEEKSKGNFIPIYSINLDVRSETSKKKLSALVHSHIFEIICEPIKVTLEKDWNENKAERHKHAKQKVRSKNVQSQKN